MRLVKGDRVIVTNNENVINAYKENGFKEEEAKPTPKRATKAK